VVEPIREKMEAKKVKTMPSTEEDDQIVLKAKAMIKRRELSTVVPRRYTTDHEGIEMNNDWRRYTKFYKFFDLGEKDYFGGRSLLIEIKPSTDSCKAGELKIDPC
jgi:hypothetical protein